MQPFGFAFCLVKPAAVQQFVWSIAGVNPGQPNEPLPLPRDSKGSSVGQSVSFPCTLAESFSRELLLEGSSDRKELATAYEGTYLLVYTLSMDLLHWHCRISQCQTAGINI